MLTFLLKLFGVIVLGVIVLGMAMCAVALTHPDELARALHQQARPAPTTTGHRR